MSEQQNKSPPQFTPGPWLVDEETRGVVTSADIPGDIVCLSPNGDHTESLLFWKANAQLIAAAPEMFEALSNAYVALLLNEKDIKPGAYSYIQSILAKGLAKARDEQP